MPTLSLSPNAEKILQDRYLKDGESSEEMFRRVARAVAQAEKKEEQSYWEEKFFELISSLTFLPNSPTLVNAGRGKSRCLSACHHRSPNDQMESIMECVTDWALIEKWGGGVGADFSALRPKGDNISTTHGYALGPVAVMEMLSFQASKITQGSFRLGAHLGTIDVNHPDILEFIHCKDNNRNIQNFNITVRVSDAFMKAVESDEEWNLINPKDGKVVNSIPARDLWNELCLSAWKTGDPGIGFFDRVLETQPNPQIGIRGGNPCLLGSTRMLTDEGLIKIEDLKRPLIYSPAGFKEAVVWNTGIRDVVNIVLSNGMSITTTPDHRFSVGDEWVSAENLEGEIEPFVGDGNWTGTEPLEDDEDYLRLGFVFGDGSRHPGEGTYVNIGKNDGDVEYLFGDAKQHKGSVYRSLYYEKHSRVTQLICDVGMELLPLTERRIPEFVFSLSPRTVCLFLRGLYTANGSILDPKYRRVTYKSTNLPLLRDIQRILLALGIKPYITTNKPTIIEWPNGTYESKQSYDLNIAGNDCLIFKDKIGFLQQYKMDRLAEISYLSNSKRHKPKVISIEPVGKAEVFDFNIPGVSSGWANGFLVHNCQEVQLEDGGSCNLGSINVSRFVNGASIDWDSFGDAIELAIRFLDDVVEVNEFPLQKLKDMNLRTRRVGLGIMGWADALVEMGISYDSEQHLQKINEVGTFLRNVAWNASMKLAEEKGPFPEWENSSLKDRLHAPTRNSCVTSIAPTGSVSRLANCSGGIEPHFSLAWKSNILWKADGSSTRMVDAPKAILDRLPIDAIEEIADNPSRAKDILWIHGLNPAVFRTAHDVSPEWHVRVLAKWQKYITDSISKTANVPKEATVEDISNVYRLAWQLGCKSVTVYRDGSKGMQVLETGRKTEQKHPEHREEVVPGNTHRILTGHGKLYVTVNEMEGKPFEVFSTLGKSGGCDGAQLEATSRLISLALRSGISKEEIIKQLKGITCCPVWQNGSQIRSPADAIAHVLSKEEEIAVHSTQNIPDSTPSTNGRRACPKCYDSIVVQEGCESCLSCGYSKCS